MVIHSITGEFGVRLAAARVAFSLLFGVGAVVQAQEDAAGGMENSSVQNATNQETPPATDFVDVDLEELLAVPLVESASRHKQSWLDAPASVTVLTAEDIETGAITTLAEAMRRVPGTYVDQTGANAFVVNLRGISRFLNKSVLVLMDGRLVSEGMTGVQNWTTLGVNPNDIERIEIIRGAGTTLYGTDATTGVINIVTKRPIDRPGMEASAWGQIAALPKQQNRNDRLAWMHNGGGAHLAQSWINPEKTLGGRLALNAALNPEFLASTPMYNNGPMQYGLSGSFEYRPNLDFSIFMSLNHAYSESINIQEFVFLVPYTNSQMNSALVFQLEKKKLFMDSLSLRVQADARQIYTRNFVENLNVGTFDMGSSASNSITDLEAHGSLMLEWASLEGRNLLTLGGEATVHSVNYVALPDVRLYFGGLILQNESYFLSDKSLILNAGLRLEQILAEGGKYGQVVHRNFNPRASLVWRMADKHSLRLSFATANRTPSPYENFLEVAYVSHPPAPPGLAFVGNPRLKPEVVISGELGYRGLWFRSLLFDWVVFFQNIEDLIADVQQNVFPRYKDNIQSIQQFGTEAALRYTPSRDFSVYLNYTFCYGWDKKTKESYTDWPRHIVGAGAEVKVPWESRINMDAYLVFDYQPTIGTMYNLEGGYPYSKWTRTRAATQATINLRFGKYLFNRGAEVFVQLNNLLGFFRGLEQLKNYPSNAVQPIGGTVFLGVRIAELF